MNSFNQFYQSKILPILVSNPNQKRMDGRESGGNREISGMFTLFNSRWKIHADTHVRMLRKAYLHYEKTKENPFEIVTTAKNKQALILIKSLREKPKHIYIYGL